MFLLKMDHKDTNSHSVIERRKSIAEMQGDNSGTLSEAKVRLLSKNLASLRLKNDDAVEDKFLRYRKMPSSKKGLT